MATSMEHVEAGPVAAKDCESETDSFESCTSGPPTPRSPAEPTEPSQVVIADKELQDVVSQLEETWGRCCGLYVHGSTIFANQIPHDLDLIAVIDEPKRKVPEDSPDSQFTVGRCEVSVYTRQCFLEKLEAMDLTMLTCLSTPSRFVLRELDDARIRDFKLDRQLLQESVTSYAEYTWLKAQRVLADWKDPYKASKNAYFVFRVLEFGCQLAEHGRIVDLQAANHKWDVINRLFKVLNIGTDDTDVLEALLARELRTALAHFAEKVTGRPSGAPGLDPPEPAWDTCVVCLESRHSESKSIEQLMSTPGDADAGKAWVQLVNCRHSFHVACIADTVRASNRAGRAGRGLSCAACPVCRTSVILDLKTSGRRQRKRRMNFAGYPATIQNFQAIQAQEAQGQEPNEPPDARGQDAQDQDGPRARGRRYSARRDRSDSD
mmetsp:Transcript_54857/g.122668  ORF Transcript_54857/g.122668 Transcript_54857/m.122668 type:complete len:435 (+) Transcript_54857:88-1392(+)